MTDLDRLRDWMREKGLDVWQLAREMGSSRHTVYSALVVRKKVSPGLVKSFIQRYGMEEGSKVFQEYFSPTKVVA